MIFLSRLGPKVDASSRVMADMQHLNRLCTPAQDKYYQTITTVLVHCSSNQYMYMLSACGYQYVLPMYLPNWSTLRSAVLSLAPVFPRR